MRTFSRWVALATLVSGAAAYADDYDFQISKLGSPIPEGANYNPTANADFRAFSRTFAAAVTSVNLTPAETLGHAAFNINAELSIINLPSAVRMPTEQAEPGTLLVPSIHVRKGLPFSVELGARVGWVEKSQMVTATGEVKWAVNEGFTYLPDLSVRGHLTRVLGVRDFNLSAFGLDVGVGKQFPVGGMVTFTPYGGLDLTFVGASSDRIDFRPDRPFEEAVQDGAISALEDTGLYQRVKFGDNLNQRLYGGVRFIGGALQLGVELSYSRLGSIEAPTPEDPGAERSLPGVLAFNTSLGLDF